MPGDSELALQGPSQPSTAGPGQGGRASPLGPRAWGLFRSPSTTTGGGLGEAPGGTWHGVAGSDSGL